MSPVFLLSLLLTLTLSEGLNDDSFSFNQTESRPCQKSRNNNAYNDFRYRHIVKSRFNRRDVKAWAQYLTSKALCGRNPIQSFICNADLKAVQDICNGGGYRQEQNLCVSKRTFRVFILRSTLNNRQCKVQVEIKHAYVTVACEVIDNRCVPVHYRTQSEQKPKRGRICKPQQSFLDFSRF